MRYFMILIVLATQGGCATVDFERKVYDPSGRELGTFIVKHNMTTAEGAALMLDAQRRFVQTEQDGDATKRVTDIASKSVDNGEPTTLTTPHGNVTSGYTGGYYDQGYGPYGGRFGYGPSQYYPGASSDMIGIEQTWRQQRGFMLPPLSEATVPYPETLQPTAPADVAAPPLARAECPQGRPPANLAEQVACTQRDVHALIRVHAPPPKKTK